MAKNTNNNNQNLQSTDQPVHMVTFLRNLEVRSLKSELKRTECQRDDIGDEFEDLQLRFDRLKAAFDKQTETIRKQQSKLKKAAEQLVHMETLQDLATMAESIFQGDLDKTSLDYLKRLYEARFSGVQVERMSVIKSGDYSMDGDFIK